jgi:hypothetical protein
MLYFAPFCAPLALYVTEHTIAAHKFAGVNFVISFPQAPTYELRIAEYFLFYGIKDVLKHQP